MDEPLSIDELSPPAGRFDAPARRVPVVSSPDVCVVGGGVAGVAAATAAARLGLQVLLVERYGFCGGATVAGLSGTICGLFSSGDRPEQIVFGFADEFHRALRGRGGAGDPVPFGRTKLVPHDAFVYKCVADDLLEASGVDVLYHALFTDAFTDGSGRAHTLLLQGKEGAVAVRPRAVVDASGDAEVVHALAGQTSLGRGGIVQTPTMVFRMGNVDMEGFLRLDPRALAEAVADAHATGRYRLPRHHVYAFPMPNGSEVLCNMTRVTYPDGRTPVGTSSADLTFAEIEGRRQAREYARFLRDCVAPFAGAYLVDTGCQVGIRQTRSVVAKARLTNDDVMSAAKVPGAATFSAWPIEAHGAEALEIVYLENDTYDVPFETLIPQAGTNVLVAGRCLDAEHEALASARVTAQCFGMGYAAGAACGLMLRERRSSQALTGTDVEAWMKVHHLKTAGEA